MNVKATGISLTPAIDDYIWKKINMLEKFFEREALASVEVGRTTKHHKSGDIFRAEIKITTNGQIYYAVSEKDDLYTAIDEVKDKIVRELTSRRKKVIRLFRRGGAKIKDLIKGIRSHF